MNNLCPYWRPELLDAEGQLESVAARNTMMLPPGTNIPQVESDFSFAQKGR